MVAWGATLRKGPLPPPEELAQYNNSFPGCAERIVAMAENQGAHRQRMESVVITGNNRREYIGQWMAFAIFAGALFFGWDLLKSGKEIAGYGAMITALGSVVGLFLLKRKDEKAKRRELQEQEAGRK